MPFPTSMNLTQAPAVEGDYASDNPRSALPGAPGAWVAGSGGVTIGRFAWGDLGVTDSILLNAGSGVPHGFVARDMGEGLITTYLTEYGMLIPQGFPVGSIFNGGDFWCKNSAGSTATIGMKAYASLTTGQVQFAATGGSIGGYIETKFIAVGFGGGTGVVGELVKISSTTLD